MNNIDKQVLREAAANAKIAGEEPVMPFDQRITALNDFMKHCTPATVLALLDELEAAEKRIAELEAREKSLRTVGVMSQKAYQRLEGRESRFIALWPRPEIYLPRKRPDDGVIVYARVAGAGKGEAS